MLEKFFRLLFAKKMLKPKRVSFNITAIYVVAGALWILLTDRVMNFFVNDTRTMLFISLIKGWAYVLLSGLLIYGLVFYTLKRVGETEKKLKESLDEFTGANRELTSANEQLIEYKEKLSALAYKDQLTGLRNRFSMTNHLRGLLDRGKENKTALFLIDIDNFKNVNDALGHASGDLLLVIIAKRLELICEEHCHLFRLGSDAFVILKESFDSTEDIDRFAVKIMKGFKKYFEIGNSNLFVTVSIGISICPDNGGTVDELMKNADIAVYKAKENGKNRIIFCNNLMDGIQTERMLIEKQLRTALGNSEFELYYQPQLEISTGRISGFEALIRWNNPLLGFVYPDRFIGIAENTQLIIPIGEWVIRSACMFLKRLQIKGFEDITMSINISMLQLLQDDFVDMLMETLDSMKLDSKYLEIEITESILMESYETIASKLKILGRKGVRIALDDFGKGYSSLNYLSQLPISTLKIDKSFIDTISSKGKNRSLTDIMVKIGRIMGLCVVAEGVETMYQMKYLIKHKCDKIQGYLFSKPIPENDVISCVEELLRNNCLKGNYSKKAIIP